MMKICFLLYSLVVVSITYGQFTRIPTYSESDRFELRFVDDRLFILGNDGYFAKMNDPFDEIIPLVTPGWSGYTRNNLNVLNKDTLFVSCHKAFPHHGFVLQSVDGGESWQSILDTTNILFTNFLMFDKDNGVVITTFRRSLLTNNGLDWLTGHHGLIGSSAAYKVNDSTAIIGILEDFNLTTDKGESWQRSYFVQSTPQAFYAANKDTIYAVTNGGVGVFFTYNLNFGEEAWVDRILLDFQPRGVFAKSIDEIYVLGLRRSSGTGQILKTTDLGLSWSFYDTGIESALDDIVFINDSIAMIGGDDGVLLKWNIKSSFETLGTNENVVEDELFTMFPNPIRDGQTVNLKLNKSVVNGKFYLLAISGEIVQIIKDGYFEKGLNSFDLNFSKLKSGVYFYCFIENDGQSYYRKVLKI